jgi:hypothetical protein
MGLSVDTNAQEVVMQFAGFLQIMQNPDKYKDILSVTAKQLADAKAMMGPCQTKEEADKYLEKAKQVLADAQEKAKADSEAFEAAKTEYLLKVQAQLAQASDKNSAAQKASMAAQVALADANAKKEENEEIVKVYAKIATDFNTANKANRPERKKRKANVKTGGRTTARKYMADESD